MLFGFQVLTRACKEGSNLVFEQQHTQTLFYGSTASQAITQAKSLFSLEIRTEGCVGRRCEKKGVRVQELFTSTLDDVS